MLWDRLLRWWNDVQEPFDVFDSVPNSQPQPDWLDQHELDCPDTQPTSPGALDSDLGDLR